MLMKKTVSTVYENFDGSISIGTSDHRPKGLPFPNDQRSSCVALPDHFVRFVIRSMQGNASESLINRLRLMPSVGTDWLLSSCGATRDSDSQAQCTSLPDSTVGLLYFLHFSEAMTE